MVEFLQLVEMICVTHFLEFFHSIRERDVQKLPDNENVETEDYDIEHGSLSDQSKCTDKYKHPISCCLLIYPLVLVCVLIVSYDTSTVNLDYLNKDINYSYSVDFDNELSGRIIGHYHHHRLRCSDFQYGCCEISYTNYLNHIQIITISPYNVVKHDLNGTNCPTLKSMVSEYNHIYPMDPAECSESTHGCCQLGGQSVNIIQNEEGSNCPRPIDMIRIYEGGYENVMEDILFMSVIGVIIGCICYFTK